MNWLERVWSAISDLFLDTETRWYLARTAWVCVQSGQSWEQIDHIYQHQVAPIVGPNLFDIAGDWAGFPDDWLFAQIRTHGDKGPTTVSRRVTAELSDLWEGVHRFYVHLSAAEETEVLLLEALSELALERHWRRCHKLYTHLKRMCDYSWPELCSAQHLVQEIYRPLLKHEGDPGPAEARRQWDWFEQFYKWVKPSVFCQVVGLMSDLDALFQVGDLSQHPSILRLRQGPIDLLQCLEGPLALLYEDPDLGLRNWKKYVA